MAIVDKGYRGVEIEGVRIRMSGQSEASPERRGHDPAA